MTIATFFDDPRHRRSEELAFFAERAERRGDIAAAQDQYAQAAALEEENALAIQGDVPRIREVLAVSAVALWLRAERWGDAARAGCAFLVHPDTLTPEGVLAIRKLVDRAWCAGDAERALGKGGSFASVEATLSGGFVRQGLAPYWVLAERRRVLAYLLLRVAEWRNRTRLRREGLEVSADDYEILDAPAISGGCSLRFYVGRTVQHEHHPLGASPRDVVDQLFTLAEAIAAEPAEVRRIVEDAADATFFLRAFRDLAPDGRSVVLVELGSMVRGRMVQVAMLTPETRERLSALLYGQQDPAT